MPIHRIGLSPLTGRIFAGTTRTQKDGTVLWVNKTDVTDEAIDAVASLIERKGGSIILTDGNGDRFIMSCAKIPEAAQ